MHHWLRPLSLVLCLVFSLFYHPASAQCPTGSLIVNRTHCQGEPVRPQFVGTGTAVEWDLCPGDLSTLPSANTVAVTGGAPGGFWLEMARQGNQYYGFYMNNGSQLIRLNFGTNPATTTPTATVMTPGVLSGPNVSIRIVEEGGNYFGFYVNETTATLGKLSFGNSLTNVPTASSLTIPNSINFTASKDLVAINQNGKKYLILATGFRNVLFILGFGTDWSGPIAYAGETPSAPNVPIGVLSAVQACGSVYVLAVANIEIRPPILLFSLGSNLEAPTNNVSQITGSQMNRSIFASMAYENGNYIGFIGGINGLQRLDFGASPTGSPAITPMPSTNAFNESFNGAMIKSPNSQTVLIANTFAAGTIARAVFASPCGISPAVSFSSSPAFKNITRTGRITIQATVSDATGAMQQFRDTTLIRSTPALGMNISRTCQSLTINGTSTTCSGFGSTISSYEWNFGDGNTNTSPTPTHTYAAAGNYVVRLNAFTASGDTLRASQTIGVDTQLPRASFVQTGGDCAQVPLTFTDASIQTRDSIASYAWDFGNGATSTLRSPVYTYLQAGNYLVRLTVTTRNGCTKDTTLNLTIRSAAKTGFTVSGLCLGETTVFTDTSTIDAPSTIVSHAWSFGDGGTSAAQNPTRVYGLGTYNVTLTTTASNGCQSVARRTISITPQPIARFGVNANAFAGDSTAFIDSSTVISQTVTQYRWVFVDANAGADTLDFRRNARHRFNQAGFYTVRLRITTSQGCITTFQRVVRVVNSCPSISLATPDTTQQNAQLALTWNANGDLRTELDFCAGDLRNTPNSSQFNLNVVGSEYVRPTYDGRNWRVFAFNRRSGENFRNAVIRLDYGASLNNAPREERLGIIGGVINNPVDMQPFQYQGSWYGFMLQSGNPNQLFRLAFDTSLGNPSPQVIQINTNANQPGNVEMRLLNHRDSLYLFSLNTVNNASTALVRYRFGRNWLNPNPASDVIAFPQFMQSSSGFISLQLVRDCNRFVGFLAAQNGRIFRVDFGTSLGSTPIFSDFTDSLIRAGLPVNALLGVLHISLEPEVGGYCMFINTQPFGNVNNIYRVQFRSGLNRAPSLSTRFTNLNNVQNILNFALAKDKSDWFAFGVDRGNRAFYRFKFPNFCAASVPYQVLSPGQNPAAVSYNLPGKHFSLGTTIDSTGNFSFAWDSTFHKGQLPVSLANCQNTTISIAAPSICTNAPLVVSQSGSSPNSTYFWNFCAGNLLNPPAQGRVVPGYTAPTNDLQAVEAVRDGNAHFVFASIGVNFQYRLQRLAFNTGFNTTPTVTDYSSLPVGTDLRIYRFKGRWLLFSVIASSQTCVMYDFGTNLSNDPVQYTFTGSTINQGLGVELVEDKGRLYGLVLSRGTRGITTFDFGTDPFSVPTERFYPTNQTGNLFRMSMIQDCGKWYGIFGNETANTVVGLTWPNGLAFDPIQVPINVGQTLTVPVGVRLARDGGNFVAFIANASGNSLVQVNFGKRLEGFNVNRSTSLTAVGLANSSYISIALANNGDYNLFTNAAGNQLNRILFPANCGANPVFSTQENPGQVTYNTFGNNTIALVVKDAEGAETEVTTPVTVVTPAVANFSVLGRRCFDSTLTFVDNTSLPTGFAREWYFGDGGNGQPQGTGQLERYKYPGAGVYNVRLRIFNQNEPNCFAERVQTIRVFPAIQPEMTIPANICSYDTITIRDATPFNGDTIVAYTWQWSLGAQVGNVGTSNNYRTAFPSAQSYAVRLNVLGRSGCSYTVLRGASVNLEGPQTTIGVNKLVSCLGDTLNFTDLTNMFGIPLRSRVWDFGDGGRTSNDTLPRYRYNAPGTYRVTLRIVNANGCSVVARQTIVVQAPANFTMTATQACVGNPTIFQITNITTASPITSYFWELGNGVSSTAAAPSIVYTTPAQFWVRLTATTQTGCVRRDSVLVNVNQSPIASFSFVRGCAGSPTTFDASASDPNGIPGGITSYQWDFGNGQTSNLETPAPVIYTRADTFNVRLTVIADGCPNTLMRRLVVPAVPIVRVERIDGCIGTPFTFSDRSTVGVRDSTVSRIWNFNGQTFTTKSINVLANQPNVDYLLTLTTTSRDGCTSAQNYTIQAGLNATARFRVLDSVFSAPPFVVRFENTSFNATGYKWDFGTGNPADTSTLASPSFVFPAVGTYRVKLRAIRAGRCFNEDSTLITVATRVTRDVTLSDLSYIVSNGRLSLTLSIKNNGNLVLRTLNLGVTINDYITLNERWTGALAPGQTVNYTFTSGVVVNQSQRVNIVCANVQLTDGTDANPNDNALCRNASEAITLLGVAPMPVTEKLTVSYAIPNAATVRIKLIDALGRETYNLLEEQQSAGFKSFVWNRNDLRSGTYVLQLMVDNEIRQQRIVVL